MKPNLFDTFRELLDDHLGKAEFVRSFENVVRKVKSVEDRLSKEVSTLAQTLTSKIESALTKFQTEFSALQSNLLSSVNNRLDTKIKEVDAKLAAVRDGLDADPEAITLDVLGRIKLPEYRAPIMDGPQEIRNKLELFIGGSEEEKIKLDAIGFLRETLDKIEADIKTVKARPSGGGGAKGFTLYTDGTKRLLTAQALNIIPGTGISVSYAYKGGRNDVTLSATGSASLSPIAVTGTIDDSNKSFTAASTPNIVIVNGQSLRDGHGVTISGTSITLDNPVGSGGDIYCL